MVFNMVMLFNEAAKVTTSYSDITHNQLRDKPLEYAFQ
jgi:hypothetical protein